jgi:hypothetical protein
MGPTSLDEFEDRMWNTGLDTDLRERGQERKGMDKY